MRETASLALAPSCLFGAIAAVALCAGCQNPSVAMEGPELRRSHGTAMPTAAAPRSASHLTVYRNVLLTSRAAPLRAAAATELGEQLADDEESVWALSVATNDDDRAVKLAARRALLKIFDARHQGATARSGWLSEFGKKARADAAELGHDAIDVISWLWNNVYFWPGVA